MEFFLFNKKKINNIFKLCIFKSRMLIVYVCWKFILKVVYLVLKNVCRNPEVAMVSLENCIWTLYILLLLIWSRLFFFKAHNSKGFLFSWEVRKWKLMEIKSDKEQNLSENCSDSHRWCSEAFFKKIIWKDLFLHQKGSFVNTQLCSATIWKC